MAGELETDDLQGPFQPKPFYDSIGIILERKDKKMGYYSVSDTTVYLIPQGNNLKSAQE